MSDALGRSCRTHVLSPPWDSVAVLLSLLSGKESIECFLHQALTRLNEYELWQAAHRDLSR